MWRLRASSKSIPEPVSGPLKIPSSPEDLEEPSAGYRAFYLSQEDSLEEKIFELGFEGKVGIPKKGQQDFFSFYPSDIS